MVQAVVDLVRSIYGDGFIPLHRPVFEGNEKQYLLDCIDSNFVSSVGAKVVEFEQQIAAFTGSKYAIATVNGTAALHVALQLAGVQRGDEVISQALTFIATCNALSYAGAHPVFVDVDRDTLGMSPVALQRCLSANAEVREGRLWNTWHRPPDRSLRADAYLRISGPHPGDRGRLRGIRHPGGRRCCGVVGQLCR
ncbi:aminotransferase class I/II-fold pyridoxal phosphate-dependent enzyme [Thermomonas sp.]|uniref:aminotransferase class I/II-fold pyridoxal phosphate-dependent enzyme n=1 Tax=Thermomonas sp. TaxID=1971895 RepID=UPI0026140AD7|nr:aminotransferase class I/II-fold pyridoxal phosphate-dependent enzyme [Thermomonas sp.]MBL0227555.1 aminotransferase class I/II-fold pyridoxal phosphate-dependent enzyme [Thermomonas sp.]